VEDKEDKIYEDKNEFDTIEKDQTFSNLIKEYE